MSERAQPFSRALDVTHAYWFAMLAASALGTNVGDLWAEILFPGRWTSLAALLVLCAAAVSYDRIAGARSEAGYWVAIIGMRAAATNLADIMTHDLALGYVTVSVLLAGLTLIAARFTHPDIARGGSPRVDGAYWIAMFIAGLCVPIGGWIDVSSLLRQSHRLGKVGRGKWNEQEHHCDKGLAGRLSDLRHLLYVFMLSVGLTFIYLLVSAGFPTTIV